MSVTVPGGTITVDTKTVNGAQQQRVVTVPGAGGTATVNHASPSLSATSVQLVSANPLRVGLKIKNNGTVRLYLFEGIAAAVASTTGCDDYLDPGDEYKADFGYTGAVQGISDPSPSGNALVREYIE